MQRPARQPAAKRRIDSHEPVPKRSEAIDDAPPPRRATCSRSVSSSARFIQAPAHFVLLLFFLIFSGRESIRLLVYGVSGLLRGGVHVTDLVSPPFRHADALIPIQAAVVRLANLIGADMRQFRLDSVAVPEATLVQEAGGAGAEAMGGVFYLRKAHAEQSAVERVFADRLSWR